jgi:hypothetical protein
MHHAAEALMELRLNNSVNWTFPLTKDGCSTAEFITVAKEIRTKYGLPTFIEHRHTAVSAVPPKKRAREEAIPEQQEQKQERRQQQPEQQQQEQQQEQQQGQTADPGAVALEWLKNQPVHEALCLMNQYLKHAVNAHLEGFTQQERPVLVGIERCMMMQLLKQLPADDEEL